MACKMRGTSLHFLVNSIVTNMLTECERPVDKEEIEVVQLEIGEGLVEGLVAAAVVALPDCSRAEGRGVSTQVAALTGQRGLEGCAAAHRGGSGTAWRR